MITRTYFVACVAIAMFLGALWGGEAVSKLKKSPPAEVQTSQ